MHLPPHTPSIAPRHTGRAAFVPRAAFTLVELLVSLVIMLILVSLSLGGMVAARSRARVERTRATIRKLHEIVIPHYESYLRRRLPLPSDLASMTPAARRAAINLARLTQIRTLMLYEMPDSWGDVALTTGTVGTLASGTRGYASARGSATFPLGDAECLYQLVAFGVNEPGALGTFRSDEIADTDGDGVPEFIDAWGTPIGFVRRRPSSSSRTRLPDSAAPITEKAWASAAMSTTAAVMATSISTNVMPRRTSDSCDGKEWMFMRRCSAAGSCGDGCGGRRCHAAVTSS
jgi:prepilin-type N-terminal cleavage/methylation domain-containing protein